MYPPHDKEKREFQQLFSQLKPSNRDYTLAIMRTLAYTQGATQYDDSNTNKKSSVEKNQTVNEDK